jgi:hypothetical protein
MTSRGMLQLDEGIGDLSVRKEGAERRVEVGRGASFSISTLTSQVPNLASCFMMLDAISWSPSFMLENGRNRLCYEDAGTEDNVGIASAWFGPQKTGLCEECPQHVGFLPRLLLVSTRNHRW